MTTPLDQVLPKTKKCRVCGYTKELAFYSKNPNAADGYNGVCTSCRGKGGKNQTNADTDALLEELFFVFRSGDPARDFFTKQLLRIALTARNEQAQLTAMKMLAESHGMDKETPKSEADLIHSAFQRMKQQQAENAKN